MLVLRSPAALMIFADGAHPPLDGRPSVIMRRYVKPSVVDGIQGHGGDIVRISRDGERGFQRIVSSDFAGS